MTGKSQKSKSNLIAEIKAHVKLTFEQISEEFDSTRYKPWPETIDYLQDVPGNARILDLGVGNGRNAVYAVKSGLNVIGIDISGKMVRLARIKYQELADKDTPGSAEFIQADFGELPLKSNYLDGVVCVASLHHIPSSDERNKAVEELYRVLKPGGSALISVWDLDQSRFKEELMRQLYSVCASAPQYRTGRGQNRKPKHPPPYEFGDVWVPWQSKNGKTYYRFYHLFYHNELVELVKPAGFKLDKYFRRADNHNVIVHK